MSAYAERRRRPAGQSVRRGAIAASLLLHAAVIAALFPLWHPSAPPEETIPPVAVIFTQDGAAGTAGGDNGGKAASQASAAASAPAAPAASAAPTATAQATRAPAAPEATPPPPTIVPPPLPPEPPVDAAPTPTPLPAPTPPPIVPPKPEIAALPPPPRPAHKPVPPKPHVVPPPAPTPPPREVAAAEPPASMPTPTPAPTPAPAPAPSPQVAAAAAGAGAQGAPGPPDQHGKGTEGTAQGAFGAGSRDGPGDEYLEELRRWLARHKRYPQEAIDKKEEGQVVVGFTLKRDGTVLQAWIEKSSGVPILDRAALTMLHDASPVPPVPARYQGSELKLAMPIDYTIGFFDKLFR